jgi:hypothetical protein
MGRKTGRKLASVPVAVIIIRFEGFVLGVRLGTLSCSPFLAPLSLPFQHCTVMRLLYSCRWNYFLVAWRWRESRGGIRIRNIVFVVVIKAISVSCGTEFAAFVCKLQLFRSSVLSSVGALAPPFLSSAGAFWHLCSQVIWFW